MIRDGPRHPLARRAAPSRAGEAHAHRDDVSQTSEAPLCDSTAVTTAPTKDSLPRHRRARLAPALPRLLNHPHVRLSGKLAAAVAVGLALLAAALLMYLSRHLSFWWDEWTWILERRGETLQTYFRPHNLEQWSTVPIAIYHLLLRTVGIGSYAPYMATLVAIHAINGLLLCRRFSKIPRLDQRNSPG